ncbi:MAG: hypothetical protein ABFD89_29695 [Bryobacteraceae bacterium]
MGSPFKAFTLQAATTQKEAVSLAPAAYNLNRYRYLIVTLAVTEAECESGDETYDFYITTENAAGAKWDLVHFPQVASTGAKTFVARIRRDLLPQQVTTAAPGVATTESATLAVASGGTDAIKSLGAGVVRHGPWGEKLGYELAVAGTIATGISYSISVEAGA